MAGRKIDDHSSWVGKGSKGSVFPMGVKIKEEHSEEGDGAVSKYEDTTEAIKATQAAGVSKIRGRPMKDGDRN
jgi:hypothetical protein